ncbi:hypothetical protein [Viridibacterium curvum]|uniref:Lipoprotein n=1 Tax=Viridibacterium curvum TaxID=1101404 RepID=A0ABP9QHW5_9RHOO
MKIAFVAVVSIFLSACAGPQATLKNFTVSGGKIIQLPVAAGGALPTEDKEIRIEVAGFLINREKLELVYTFGFTEKNKSTPKKVVVEDVTGTEAVQLVQDDTPALVAHGYWIGSSTPRKSNDPSIAWLAQNGDTEKVFRFTIHTADGRVLVLHQASVWSGAAKPPLRQMLNM